MDPTAAPWQPLVSLLSPSLLLLVPLVALATHGLLALPGLKRLRDFGFLFSAVVGIAVVQGQAILQTGAAAMSAQALLHGVILGALASIGYKGAMRR